MDLQLLGLYPDGRLERGFLTAETEQLCVISMAHSATFGGSVCPSLVVCGQQPVLQSVASQLHHYPCGLSYGSVHSHQVITVCGRLYSVLA